MLSFCELWEGTSGSSIKVSVQSHGDGDDILLMNSQKGYFDGQDLIDRDAVRRIVPLS